MKNVDFQSVIEAIRVEIKKAMKQEDIGGLAIALVDKDKIIWSEGFGYTDLSQKEKVTADTIFSIQSMSKTITVLAILAAGNKGLLNLDNSIKKYYSDFSINTRFGEKDQEIDKITFRRALGHTAGFTHEAPKGGNYDYTPYSFEEHVLSINDSWLRSKVGTEFAYSNLGYDVAAYALGKLKNESFPSVVKELLFEPLGITKATFNVKEAQKESFAKGHIGNFQTPVVQIPLLGSGAVYISANEQAQLTMLILNKGKYNEKQLIKPELFEELYKPLIEKNGFEYTYRLGLYKDVPIKGAEVWAHGGGGYGYLTYNTWIPEHGFGAIVFTNGMHHSGQNVKLARKALELILKEITKPKSVKISDKKLDRLVGTYYTVRNPLYNIIKKGGKLISYNIRGEKEILYPQSELEFLTESGTKYTFTLDENEKVKTLEKLTENEFDILKYNDGPNDSPGPDKKEWKKYFGIYELTHCGIEHYTLLGESNGYLSIFTNQKWKLEHYQDNIYFTADGEAVILEDENNISYRNIPLKKIEIDTSRLLKEFTTNKQKREAYKNEFESVIGVLYWSQGFEESFSFILEAIKIDEELKDLLAKLGAWLYCYQKLPQAKKCFEKLLTIDDSDKKAQGMMKKIEIEL